MISSVRSSEKDPRQVRWIAPLGFFLLLWYSTVTMIKEKPVSFEEDSPHERVLDGKEREIFVGELATYIAGLEAMLADSNLPIEERNELEEQLAALKDSHEAIGEGGDVKEIIK